ncbi:hypothetical protein [Candidatus Ruthturnera calyptogenae]|nr:hypothetical protein [Candidatus Ruthturnera calyptogenae]
MDRVTNVVIKEQKNLLIPREMPYSIIHLENMFKLSHLDVVIIDTNPTF